MPINMQMADTKRCCTLCNTTAFRRYASAVDTRSECIAQIQGEKGFNTMRSETSRCAYTIQIGRERAEHPSIVQNDVALYYELQISVIFMLDDYVSAVHSRCLFKNGYGGV